MQSDQVAKRVISVAVPVPLRQTFDFVMPESGLQPQLGARVRVPFGPRKLIGVIVAVKSHSDYPTSKLKTAIEVLDAEPIYQPHLWSTLQWLASYYLAPIGEVLELAMPVKLRQGDACSPASLKTWRLSETGRSAPIDELQRAPLQLAIIKRFMRNSSLSSTDFRNETGSWRQAIKALLEKGWLLEFSQLPKLSLPQTEQDGERSAGAGKPPITLNEQQRLASDSLLASIASGEFSCSLLHGVTGSGKTEVYFEAMHEVIKAGKQVLYLVPEIGLTPQLIERIEANFECPVVVMHSALNETERHLAWWHAQQGNARIVVGTRSAVFSAFVSLGLIVVDEEHDASFKQQDGVRYQARDVAIYRAKQESIACILGSATPSLESYYNAQRGRYQKIQLTQRATNVALPSIELFDTNKLPSSDGLSPPMLASISHTLGLGKQVMLFLNRRGYAPVMYCSACGDTSKCHRCDSNLTLHRQANRVRCHHCGFDGIAREQCASCKQLTMVEVGEGTQRVEEALALRFPQARVLRIDRDSTRRKGELAAHLQQARDGEADILLGTQLLTKGHDFPDVAMVGILGADQGLYSTDFRASEVLFQQIMQVAGRAGRRHTVGRVYIQTAFPEHTFFEWMRNHDYHGFAHSLLEERSSAAYPPFGYFALVRAESPHQAKALQFLRNAKGNIHALAGVRVMDAVPAPMELRAGRYRAQLLICSEQRSSLHQSLSAWLDFIAQNSAAKKLASSVRWSLDIDPFDLY